MEKEEYVIKILKELLEFIEKEKFSFDDEGQIQLINVFCLEHYINAEIAHQLSNKEKNNE